VTPADKLPLQDAMRLVVQHSEGQNFGICADTPQEAFTALLSYLKGLGYGVEETTMPESPTNGSCYLKYNSLQQSFYLNDYDGTYRGVLLACQGSEAVNGTYGYFPLDLFEGDQESIPT
jgi:hypothetical protein